MQTGMSMPSLRRRFTTLTPSSRGIVTSRTITAGGCCATALERLQAVGGGGNGEALEAQCALEGLPDGRLVVDDEDKRIATDHASHDGRGSR
jgi:hypothetical protein